MDTVELCGVWSGGVDMGPGSNKDISPRLEHLVDWGWGAIGGSHGKGKYSLGFRNVFYNYILMCSDELAEIRVRGGS